MKLENIVLLGFVDSALEYLEGQLKKDRNERIGHFDMTDMKQAEEKLTGDLIDSMDDYSDSVNTLKESGSRAFERFLRERDLPQEETSALIDEFDKIFAGITEDIFNEAEELMEPYQNDVEEEYMRLIADASARAREEEILSLDVDSLFEEVTEETENNTSDPIDDLFQEIIDHEEMHLETPEKEEEVIEEETYMSSLIEDLKRQLQKEEEARKAEAAERMSVYEKINEIYPYLTPGFIRAVYDMKNSIAIEYPRSENIVLLHRLVFSDLEELRQFVEIVLGHDYNVNVDENRLIVDVFKEFYNTDGKIITNIFEIANQAKLLNGEYDGYRVILKEDR